jgi:glycosyltransferase involved in cell wall biosynthesis
MMASSRATIVPSRSDALPLTAIESMAVGTPVVASAVGGLPELVRDGVDGLLVPPEDPAALAQAMREVTPAMGERARERFLEAFSLTSSAPARARQLENLVNAHA